MVIHRKLSGKLCSEVDNVDPWLDGEDLFFIDLQRQSKSNRPRKFPLREILA
jgi:hypothetical protein